MVTNNMENKQTAVEWLMDKMLQNENANFIGGRYLTLYEIRERAKAREKEQIKKAYIDGCIGEMYEVSATYTAEEYYNATYANDTTKGLPKEDSKRRGWHY